MAKPVAKPMAKKDKPSGARTARGDAGSLPALTSDDTGMLDAIDLPAIIINRDCRVARINLAATAALGFTAADVGRPPGEILPASKTWIGFARKRSRAEHPVAWKRGMATGLFCLTAWDSSWQRST